MKIFYIIFILAIICLCGCGKKNIYKQTDINMKSGDFSILITKNDKSEYIKISKNDKKYDIYCNGKKAGIIENKGEKLKLYNVDESEYGKIQLDGNDIKLKDANEQKIAKVKCEDGNITIKDSANNKIIKIKPESYGYKIDDSNSNKIGKITNKDSTYYISDIKDVKFIVSGKCSAGITGVLLTDKFSPMQQAALIAGYNLLIQSGN